MLLANKKIVILLLSFLKAIEIKTKKAAREQKKEWEWRNDQVEEKMFAYRQ